MKLNVRHTYSCTPEKFWEMFWDDAFDEVLRASSTVKRELIEQREEAGGVILRRIRFTPERELPGPAASLIGSTKLVYEQENRYDPRASALHWRVLPTFLPGRFDAAGKFEVKPTATGCEQLITGEVKVNVTFIGGTIEKAICAEIEGAYEKTASAARDWLRRGA